MSFCWKDPGAWCGHNGGGIRHLECKYWGRWRSGITSALAEEGVQHCRMSHPGRCWQRRDDTHGMLCGGDLISCTAMRNCHLNHRHTNRLQQSYKCVQEIGPQL